MQLLFVCWQVLPINKWLETHNQGQLCLHFNHKTQVTRVLKTYKNFSAKYMAKYNVLVKDNQLVYKKISKKQRTKLSNLIEQMFYNYNGTNEDDEKKKGFF